MSENNIETIWHGWQSIADIEEDFNFNYYDELFICANKLNDFEGVIILIKYDCIGIVTQKNGAKDWIVSFIGYDDLDNILKSYMFNNIDKVKLLELLEPYK